MKSVRAALAVQNCPAGRFDSNLSSTVDLATRAARNQADMVVFPEMNLTGYAAGEIITHIARPLDHDLLSPLSTLSEKYGITILAGMAELVNPNKKTPRICASHLVFTPGKPVGIYRKLHTAPNEKAHFSPGNQIKIFSSTMLKYGIQLCYDAHFPELSTAMASKGAEAFFFPHASPRGNARDKYLSWMRHLSARAFDNGVFVAAVNQTGENDQGLSFPGIALFIGPDGRVISMSLKTEEHLHMISLDPKRMDHVRSHRMRYFFPNRRTDLFRLQ